MTCLRYCPSVLLVVLALSISAIAQDTTFDTKKPRANQLSHAYGYLVGQQKTLDFIAEKFPVLAASVKTAEFEFQSSALGQGGEGLGVEMQKLTGAQWDEVRREIGSTMEAQIRASGITRDDAEAFIGAVVARSKGEMPEDIRRALLANNPRFKADPGLELSEGWRRTFRTKGHPKAGDVDISIDVPESWYEREGRQSDILRVFRSGNGHGDLLLTLSVVPFDEEDKREMEGMKLTKDLIAEFLPEGVRGLSSQETMLSGAQSVLTVYDQEQKQLGEMVAMRNTAFWVLLDDGIVVVNFAFMKPLSMSPEEVDAIHKRRTLSYKLIASTLSLTGSKPHSSRPNQAPVEGMSGTGFVISSSGLVITAHHVVDGAKNIRVYRGSKGYVAEVVTANKTLDLALLRTDAALNPLRMAPSQSVRLAQGVFTIGFPNTDVQGLSPKVTRGEISSLSGLRDSPRHWQISAPVQPGNSGGPLFDTSGRVIGMVVSTLTATSSGSIPQNVNYALKGDFIRSALKADLPDEPLANPSHAGSSEDLESVVSKVQNSIVRIIAE